MTTYDAITFTAEPVTMSEADWLSLLGRTVTLYVEPIIGTHKTVSGTVERYIADAGSIVLTDATVTRVTGRHPGLVHKAARRRVWLGDVVRVNALLF